MRLFDEGHLTCALVGLGVSSARLLDSSRASARKVREARMPKCYASFA
jgi:hypothetical protein